MPHPAAKRNDLTPMGFLWRLVFCLGLVLLSFNPSGYSAFHWISTSIGEAKFGSVQAIVIVLLFIGWTVVVVATWRALDALGVVLVTLALGAIVWLLVDLGVVTAKSFSAVAWIVLVCLAVTLAIGMSWSHVWRRLTGQVNVEDVDD